MRGSMPPLPCETGDSGGREMGGRAGRRRNRVDPWGDLIATRERGLFTGNRGCLVDDREQVVRHHQSSAWIVCRLSYRDQRVPLARPHAWTPIFFLDDAVALAAGHRPCAFCRRGDYLVYQRAVTDALRWDRPVPALEIDKRLAAERMKSGRGLERARDRRTCEAPARDLPDGTVIVVSGTPTLLVGDRALTFSFAGWQPAGHRPHGTATVLTPETSLLALKSGFPPVLHPSASDQPGAWTEMEIR